MGEPFAKDAARRMRKEPDTSAEAEFTAWFRKNYPGPDTIIYDPDWHSPKIYRAATRALAAERDALQTKLDEAVQRLRGEAAIAKPSEHSPDEQWMLDETSLRLALEECRQCVRSTLAKLKGETDE